MSDSRFRQWLPLDLAEADDADDDLTDKQLAVYVRLIKKAWKREGSLPVDSAMLSKWAKAPESVWRPVLRYFELAGDEYVHQGLRAHLATAHDISEKRRQAANVKHANARAKAPANVVHLKEQKDVQ